MYSTRFIGNKAYLVTYKTIDPLFVIKLSNEKNPKEISKTVIGDSRTTSAVLTNSKALLFSKEKNLLAIPVNNYEEDFELDITDDTYSLVIDSYINYNKTYNACSIIFFRNNINYFCIIYNTPCIFFYL